MSKLYVCKQYDTPYERVCKIITTLDEHDYDLLDKVLEKLKAEMIEDYPPNINGVKAPTPFAQFSYCGMCKILDRVIAELKAEVEK